MVQMAANSGSVATIEDAKITEMRMSLRGPIITQEDPAYDESRLIYNAMFDKRPGMIIRCRSTADVIDAINFGRENDLLIAVRGGGHNVAGNSSCDDGLLIDLSLMNAVFLNRKSKTVRVQGGATWGDVDRETQAFGLAVPGGIVSETGVAGLTLNGGIGWLRSKYGLSCDNLLSAEVVTASGEVLTASAEENPDLYWALRGGGGNFGVVTSFEFQAHPVGPIVAAALPVYPIEEAGSLMRKWRDFVAAAPDEVTSAVVMWTFPVVDALPEEIRGKAVCVTAAVYAGDPARGEEVLIPLRKLSTPLFDMSGQLPYRGVQSSFDPFFQKGTVSSYWKSLFVREMSDEVIDLVTKAAQSRTSSYSLMNVPYMGNGVRRVSPDATAFAARDAAFMVSIDANWLEKGRNDTHIAWARGLWDALQPYSTGDVYLNFMGQEDQDADKLVRAGLGRNYERLAQIKAKHDPKNLFRINQNIKPNA
jgi:FAD/FMN-containing dehydrogenase